MEEETTEQLIDPSIFRKIDKGAITNDTITNHIASIFIPDENYSSLDSAFRDTFPYADFDVFSRQHDPQPGLSVFMNRWSIETFGPSITNAGQESKPFLHYFGTIIEEIIKLRGDNREDPYVVTYCGYFFSCLLDEYIHRTIATAPNKALLELRSKYDSDMWTYWLSHINESGIITQPMRQLAKDKAHGARKLESVRYKHTIRDEVPPVARVENETQS